MASENKLCSHLLSSETQNLIFVLCWGHLYDLWVLLYCQCDIQGFQLTTHLWGVELTDYIDFLFKMMGIAACTLYVQMGSRYIVLLISWFYCQNSDFFFNLKLLVVMCRISEMYHHFQPICPHFRKQRAGWSRFYLKVWKGSQTYSRGRGRRDIRAGRWKLRGRHISF